jgi:hypothetical protein
MGNGTTYDKVSWHFPEGKNCPSLEAAKVHLDVVMYWLESEGLLSAEGSEVMEIGIDSDFALTSYMLNDKGNQLLARYYAEWVSTVQYGTRPSVKLLEDRLQKIESGE